MIASAPLAAPSTAALPYHPRFHRLAGVCFLAIVCLQQTLIWRHVPWLDEIISVLLARDSHTLSDWYWNFRYDGHPPLWHLFLKLGWLAGLDGVMTLHVAAALCTLGMTTLIFFASPFPLWLRVALGLNSFLLFEFGAISRSYSLGALLLFAFVAFRRHRVAWVFLALLPLIHILFSMMAGLLCLIAWLEKRIDWPGAIATGATMALGLFLAWPATNAGSSWSLTGGAFPLLAAQLTSMMAATNLLPWTIDGHLTGWSGFEPEPFYFALGSCLPIVVVAAQGRDRIAQGAVMALLTATCLLSTFRYPLSARHLQLIFLFSIALLWLRGASMGQVPLAARLWIVWIGLNGCFGVAFGWHEPFSATGQISDWVATSHERDTLFISVEHHLGTEFSLATSRPALDIGPRCLETFPVPFKPVYTLSDRAEPFPTRDLIAMSPENVLGWAKDAAAGAGGRALLVVTTEAHALMQTVRDPDLRLLKTFLENGDLWQPRFIWEVRSPAGPPVSYPTCLEKALAGR